MGAMYVVMSRCESVDSFTPCYLARSANMKLLVLLAVSTQLKAIFCYDFSNVHCLKSSKTGIP